MTANEYAIDLMLKGDQKGLQRLAAQVRNLHENILTCPECGSRGPHQDNGASRAYDLTYLCEGCGTQWDAEEV